MKDTCRYNHNAVRYANNICSECSKIAAKKCRKKNLEKAREREKIAQQKRRDEKKEHINALRRERYKINRKKIIAAAKIQKAWRRAQKLKACPPWVDKTKLKEIYDNCPEGMQVDHIIPLKHKLVSGLHTPENLQYLTKEDNIRKSNTFPLAI